MYLYLSFEKRVAENLFLMEKGWNLASFLVYILKSMGFLDCSNVVLEGGKFGEYGYGSKVVFALSLVDCCSVNWVYGGLSDVI